MTIENPKATEVFESPPKNLEHVHLLHDNNTVTTITSLSKNQHHKIQIISLSKPTEYSATSHNSSKSFVYSKSFIHELLIQFQIFFPICLTNIFGYLPQIISYIIIGNIKNGELYLSGINLGRTYSNITGVSIAWGINSALYTLIPHSIGAKRKDLLKEYIQRCIIINLITFIPLTILQLYSYKIMMFIFKKNDDSLEDILFICYEYCIYGLPYIYFNSLSTVFKRICQSCNYNKQLLIIFLICALLSYPLNLFFVNNLSYVHFFLYIYL